MRTILILLLIVLELPRADAASKRLDCTAWGGSHTGKYTFDIDLSVCRLFWREIDTELRVVVCEPPRMEAI